MIKWGFAGAALLTWVYAFSQFLTLAKRGSPRSALHTIELANHAEQFFITTAEAWGLAMLAALSVIFFMVGWVLHHRIVRNTGAGGTV